MRVSKSCSARISRSKFLLFFRRLAKSSHQSTMAGYRLDFAVARLLLYADPAIDPDPHAADLMDFPRQYPLDPK